MACMIVHDPCFESLTQDLARRWYEVCQERVAATEQLRICIAAKRISFRLFKQIYWQSFDEDIQVCPPERLHHSEP